MSARQLVDQRVERVAQVAVQGDVGGDDLAELGRVDVGVDDGRLAREAIGLAGDAVVEAHPQREDEVGALHRLVGGLETVHAEHAEVVGVAGCGGSERVDGRRVRQPQHRGEQPVELDGARPHAAADDRDGPPRGTNPRDGVADRGIGRARSRSRHGSREAGSAAVGRRRDGALSTSLGMSTRTGPGRPLRASANASRDRRGDCAGVGTRKLRLVTGCVIAQTSASWKPSVPISSVRTWPVIATSGTLSIIASSSPVTRLVAPGPGGRAADADAARRARVAAGGERRRRFVAHEHVPHRDARTAHRRAA